MVHSYSKLLIFTLGLKWSLWASGIHSGGSEWCILIFRLPIVLLTHLLATIQVLISLKLEWLAYLWLNRPKMRSQHSYMLPWEMGCLLFWKWKTRLWISSRVQGWSQHTLQSQPHDQELCIIKNGGLLLPRKWKTNVNVSKWHIIFTWKTLTFLVFLCPREGLISKPRTSVPNK